MFVPVTTNNRLSASSRNKRYSTTDNLRVAANRAVESSDMQVQGIWLDGTALNTKAVTVLAPPVISMLRATDYAFDIYPIVSELNMLL